MATREGFCAKSSGSGLMGSFNGSAFEPAAAASKEAISSSLKHPRFMTAAYRWREGGIVRRVPVVAAAGTFHNRKRMIS